MRLSGGPFSPMIYSCEVAHLGLKKRRTFRHKDQGVMVERVNDQLNRWRAEYARLVRRESGREAAEEATSDAETALHECAAILEGAIQPGRGSSGGASAEKSFRIGQSLYHDPRQTEGIRYNPTTGEPTSYWPAGPPKGRAPRYKPPPATMLGRVFPGVQKGREDAARAAFDRESREWEMALKSAERTDSTRQQTLEREKREWQEREGARLRYARWHSGDSQPIEDHTERVLNASEYPDWIEDALDFDLRFDVDARTLVVEFELPPQESMPTLASVTYIQSKGELREKHIGVREQDRLYGDVLYQIALRTVHELYTSDEIEAFEAIAFNGWIEAIDPATGHLVKRPILSLRARREEFLRLNLADVEPEACFRSLGGVAGSRLAKLERVEPIEPLYRSATTRGGPNE